MTCGSRKPLNAVQMPLYPEYAQAAYEEMKAGIADAKENCEEFCKQAVKKVKLAPIVSSAKSAQVICRLWDRKYKQVPDFVVVEGPLAGGHLGFSREELAEYGADTKDVPNTYNQEAYDKEVRSIMEVIKTYEEKYQKHIPVVTAGGIYTHEDVKHQFELGAEGVQVATRFVTTEECDAPDAYKQAYINAKKEDIVITQSPVGMPGRAIRNRFLEEKEHHHHAWRARRSAGQGPGDFEAVRRQAQADHLLQRGHAHRQPVCRRHALRARQCGAGRCDRICHGSGEAGKILRRRISLFDTVCLD